MRVHISVDMEGIGGISHPHPTDREGRRYAGSVDLMVGEANAAIEGALAAGATDILVNDSHASMHNLLPEAIHPAATPAPGPEGVVDGRRSGVDGSTSRCSSATTPVPATRAGRSRTPIRADRSKRGSMAGRPASTA